MEKELWLSRDNSNIGEYNIGEGEPQFDGNGYVIGVITYFEAELFHKLFPGQSLRKGRKRKIKRILIELED